MKLLLAYSGGFVNSVAIHWLRHHRGYRVFTFSANVGGDNEDLEALAEQALAFGAEGAHIADVRETFLSEFVYPTLKAGARYEHAYLLATALSRPLIARELVRLAREEGCRSVGHGCIGKGNDQFRIETAISGLAPGLRIVATRRAWAFSDLSEVVSYATRNRLPVHDNLTASEYTRDQNIWGARVSGGALEDPTVGPPADVYELTAEPEAAPDTPAIVAVTFEAGAPIGIDGERLSGIKLVDRLNALGGEHGVGRADIVENRLVGHKVREIYEAPAASILFAAHQALEQLVLDAETSHFQPTLAQKFAELVYNGQWFTDLREALSAFFERSQQFMSGTVTLRLYKGGVSVLARESPYSLYDADAATIARVGSFDSEAVSGYLSLMTGTRRILAAVRRGEMRGRQTSSGRLLMVDGTDAASVREAAARAQAPSSERAAAVGEPSSRSNPPTSA